MWIDSPSPCKTIANNKRGGARRRTKRSVQRRNNAPKSNGFAQDMRVAKLALGKNLVFGFPDRMQTKLRYNDTLVITTGAGPVVGFKLIGINDIFAPVTGGHQPMYRDTYATIYDNYSVVSARLIAKFLNTSATAVFKVGAVIEDRFGGGPLTDPIELAERNHGQHTILPPLAGSLSTHTFTIPWSVRTVLGVDPYTSQTYKTPVGSSPTILSFIQLWVIDLTAGVAGTTVDFTVEFDVLFSELSSPPTS